MDYEKKYNEALERARKVHRNYKNLFPEYSYSDDIEEIFPELRESEDERVRRCIGMALTDVDEQRFKDFGTTLKDCIAWLEKQKVLTEHKEGIYYYHRDGTFTFISHPAVENPHNFTVPKPNEKPVDYDHEMWKNCEANFEGGKKEVIDHPEKYGLQKEQKPEWSEDDKNMWTHLNGYLNGFSCSENAIKQMADWFYELPNRFNLQPKQEWSEEDEIHVRSIFGDFRQDVVPDEEDQYWLKKKLESLRPSWKPSEEQMALLRAVINDPNNAGAESCQLVLREIYQQFKKL